MVEDARQRNITWWNAHDVPANITKDDDATAASTINQFEKPPYQLERIYYGTKNVDGIQTWITTTAEPLHDWKHETYAYNENQPILLTAVTKQGITGDKLRWKMETELRRIEETYPLGSVRNMRRSAPVEMDMGTFKQFAVRYDMSYKRAVDDYTSDCTLSYGNNALGTGFHYGGLRVDGGVEGQWGDGATAVDVDGGSTVTQNINTNPGHLTFDLTVFVGDAYSNNATNLNLSTVTTTKIRWRFKTTGNATAKIICTDDGGYSQTVLAETASSTFVEGSATLTSGETLDHIQLYCCDGVGTVLYDFVQVYQADFTIPNVTDLRFTPSSRNVNLGIPSSVALGFQNLGADPARIDLDCDLDLQTSSTAGAAGCWKRTGDTDNAQVFLDVLHNQSRDAPWQWFVWGNKTARVVIDDVSINGFDGTCRLTMHEYSDSNKRTETVAERWHS